MKITSVSYRELVTGPGYSNKAVEATAQVADYEDPEGVLLNLAAWVKIQLGEGGPLRHTPESLREEIGFLTRHRDQLRAAHATAELELRRVRDTLAEAERLLKDQQPQEGSTGGEAPGVPEPEMPF